MVQCRIIRYGIHENKLWNHHQTLGLIKSQNLRIGLFTQKCGWQFQVLVVLFTGIYLEYPSSGTHMVNKFNSLIISGLNIAIWTALKICTKTDGTQIDRSESQEVNIVPTLE